MTDVFAWAHKEVPEWNTISISGYHIREAGSTAVQEVAFTFANAIAYIESAIAAGMDVDSFAPRLSFFFNAHSDFLTEIAKFRAARRMYAKLMRDRFRAKNERSCMLRFHTQTAGSSLTAQQPEVNWSAPRSKLFPQCWAEHSRSTPTHGTRRSDCQPKPLHNSPCAPSR